jgi:hypothetical protein
MANDRLSQAKSDKNDEFYTQYPDIEKEMNAYLEYNPAVFQGKIVLLPCDDPEWSNFTKYFADIKRESRGFLMDRWGDSRSDRDALDAWITREDSDFLGEPYYEDELVTLYHGDCREILPELGPDVIVTDPPYNVGKDYGTSKDDLSPEDYEAMLTMVAAAADRQAWVASNVHLEMFLRVLGSAHLVVIRRGASGPLRGGWSSQYAPVLVRGKPLRVMPDLWDGIRLVGEGYYFREETFDHPGYTPLPIMARLVELTAESTNLVCDPFAGSGTALVAAKQLGIRAVGIELNEPYCEIAAKRLAQGVMFGVA